MDEIENTARRAFVLAINCYNSELRPNADAVEFNFIASHHYELRISVDGYTCIGSYDSRHENQDLMVEVVLTEVIAPDGSKTRPHLKHDPFLSELGENYAELYGG